MMTTWLRTNRCCPVLFLLLSLMLCNVVKAQTAVPPTAPPPPPLPTTAPIPSPAPARPTGVATPAPANPEAQPMPPSANASPSAPAAPPASGSWWPWSRTPAKSSNSANSPDSEPALPTRDPTVASPRMRELLIRDRTPTSPTLERAVVLPKLRLVGRIVHRDGTVAALVSIDGSIQPVRLGTTFQVLAGGGGILTFEAVAVTTTGVTMKIMPIEQELTLQ